VIGALSCSIFEVRPAAFSVCDHSSYPKRAQANACLTFLLAARGQRRTTFEGYRTSVLRTCLMIWLAWHVGSSRGSCAIPMHVSVASFVTDHLLPNVKPRSGIPPIPLRHLRLRRHQYVSLRVAFRNIRRCDSRAAFHSRPFCNPRPFDRRAPYRLASWLRLYQRPYREQARPY